MSCKCDPCCVECIKVNTVAVTTTAVDLVETQINLAGLPVGQRIELIVDPEELPDNTLPVALTDGTTTIPLWMENGNVMRENTFLPFCRRRAKCCKGFARLKMRYLADPNHLIVYCSKRY